MGSLLASPAQCTFSLVVALLCQDRGVNSTGKPVTRCQWGGLGISQEPLGLIGHIQCYRFFFLCVIYGLYSPSVRHNLSQSIPIPLYTFLALPHLCSTPTSFDTFHSSHNQVRLALKRITELIRHIRSSSNSTCSFFFGSYKFIVFLFWRALALDYSMHFNVT